MRAALALCALVSCAPRPGTPKCVDPPAPAEDEFAACGGMIHHTGPGPAVPFKIAFKNELGSAFELVSVCVLVDDYSLFAKEKHEWSGTLFRGKHVLKVRAEYRSNGATLTVRSAAEIVTTESGDATIVAYEQGGPTTPLEQRAAVRWVRPKCE